MIVYRVIETNGGFTDYAEIPNLPYIEVIIEEISQEQIYQNLHEKETEAYKKRAKDGQDAYANLSAEFRLAKLNGQITEQAYAYVENLLIPIRNEVIAGQWKSSKVKLEDLGSNEIGQSLYDRLLLQITNYITLSYNE